MSKVDRKEFVKNNTEAGFFGIAVYNPKIPVNVGTLWRTAHNLGANFLALIGRRYKYQKSDTLKSHRHIPLFEFENFEDFIKFKPFNCNLTAIEISENAKYLKDYEHKRREIYLLGAEDYGIPEKYLQKCDNVIKLSGKRCLNVAVAGSIVLYDREGK